MKQFLIFVRKEWYHIWRDKRTLFILIGMPVIQIILYGFALTNEVKNSRIAVLDEARDPASIALIQQIDASRYFDVVRVVHTGEDIQAVFREGKIRMAVIFPQGFRNELMHTNHAQIQLVADASDPNTANTLTNYASAIISDYQMSLNQVCAMMTSISIVKEKEMGTMEVILISPLKPFRIVLAKTVPYLLISLVNIISILLLSVFALDVPIVGNLWLLMGESMLFTGTSLALGLLISNTARTQQTAMFTSMMSLFLPTLLFSGFLFPVENMPVALQVISNVVPAKWYFIIVKSVMIKGLGLETVWKETLVLVVMTLLLLGISIRNFKIRLE